MKKYTDYIDNKEFTEILEGKKLQNLIKSGKKFLKWMFGKNSNKDFNKENIKQEIINKKLKYVIYDEDDVIKFINKNKIFNDTKKTLEKKEYKDIDDKKFIIYNFKNEYCALACYLPDNYNKTNKYYKYIKILFLEIIDEYIDNESLTQSYINVLRTAEPESKGMQIKSDSKILKKIGFKENPDNKDYLIYSYEENVTESIDENFLWKLEKWFDRNEEQEQEFIGLIITYKNDKSNFDDELKGTQLYKNLKEFVNFLTDDITFDSTKDYVYQLKKIIENAINNKSEENKYNK